MRKAIFVLLAVLCLLTSCSGGGDSASQEATASADFVYDGNGPITDLEGQTLSVLAQNSYYTTVDLRSAEIVKRVQEGANVTIDWTLVDPVNYIDAVSPMLASGVDLPDIILMPNLDENQSYITSGMVEPLDEHFDVMPNFSAWLDANPTIKASLTASDGHIYYVPTTNVTANYQPVIMYNMKWLSDAGLEMPTTLDEFVEMLRYYKSHDMNGNGELDEVPLSVQDEYLMYMFGPAFGLNFISTEGSGFFVNDEGVVQYAQATPEYKEYLSFLHDLYTEGLLEIEYTTLTRDQIIERFAQDRAGVTFDFSWQMSMTYSPQLPYYDGTPETGVVGGVPLSGPHEGFFIGRNAIGSIFGVNASSDKIELACKWLDYAMSEANQVMYCWGIEGLSYVEDENGNRTFTEQASDNTWLQGLGINPAQVLPAHQSVESTDALVPAWHAEVDKMQAQYIQDPWPFIYATEEESMTASMYMVDIQTYVNEMAVSFVTGTTPLSEYDAYLEALDRMNLPEMLEIRTAQYERFSNALEN